MARLDSVFDATTEQKTEASRVGTCQDDSGVGGMEPPMKGLSGRLPIQHSLMVQQPVKVVIFSQWTSMLDLIEGALKSRQKAVKQLSSHSTSTSLASLGLSSITEKLSSPPVNRKVAPAAADEDADTVDTVDTVVPAETTHESSVSSAPSVESSPVPLSRYQDLGEYRRLDGKMSQATRSAAVSQFTSDPRVRTLLVSLR